MVEKCVLDFITKLNLFDCSCGQANMLRWPCKHMLSAARYKGMEWYELFHPLQRTEKWKATYEAMGEPKNPAPNSVFSLFCLPITGTL